MIDEFTAIIPEGDERIRCSSLDTVIDCARRWAAVHRRQLLSAAGFTLTYRPPSIGATVGSGSHAGIAVLWHGRMNGGDWSPIDDAAQAATETIRRRLEDEGAQFDDTTPDRNDAEHAARKIITVYRRDADSRRRPLMIERALAARIKPGWWLTGHLDLYTQAARRHLEDYKTGVRIPSPLAQTGGYDGQLEAAGQAPDTTGMTFIRRTRRSTAQPPPMSVLFDRGVIRRQARTAINEIIGSVERFNVSGDPAEFRANPASMLCHPNWCPAWKTKFCPESWGKPDAKD